MTHASFFYRDGSFSAELQGHAEYSPGNDIVCAAISQLAFTFGQLVLQGEKEGKVAVGEVRLEPGDTSITFYVHNKKDRHEFLSHLSFFITGMKMLHEEFPDYVAIEDDAF